MSWYQTPIQPIDPIVQSQTPKPPIRYMRDNFTGTGQVSYVKPPAQDQSQWSVLTNVQPITQGILNQRWGYTTFAGLTGTPNRLAIFQSDATGTRAILATGHANVSAFDESGNSYNANVFTPVTSNNIIRSITSRNYQYFCDGTNALDPSTHRTGDSLKWNGAASGGVTNFGIVSTDVTSNTPGGGTTSNVLGPDAGGTATDLADNSNAWTNITGMLNNNPASPASATVSETYTSFIKPDGCFGYGIAPGAKLKTDTAQLEQFGFSSVPGTIAGIQVAITYKATLGGPLNGSGSLFVTMVKNNVSTGFVRSSAVQLDGATHTITMGSSTDLWGTSWAEADIASTQFGVQVHGTSMFTPIRDCLNDNSGTGTIIFNIQYVTITVYLGGATGTSSSSGNGVGIASGVGGGTINLTIGRTYYLVPNNSLTGHFGDLSSASASSGAATNAEYNLLLATYNDPQVDTKYVLATADGGDPSILYETQVLVPGLVITSWAIAANVVTFTGTYFGSAFATGATVTIGGLSHGSYMNGLVMTVTGSTGTTFTAAFTHANDSATETGVAGNASFSIPNGVTQVVDNTPDPTLVLNQPLVFTDNFGNEFGLTLNDPPPSGNLIVKHQGRLWMAGVAGATHSVYFSKSVSELTLPNGFIAGKYEECWPGSNYFDVSDGAESVTGLLSDGTTLYIGTQNHIRRLLGNSPDNFQEPSVVHPEVGLLNQEVWQIVFMQGAPSGSIWVTPDLRIIQSDFNTYVDIGAPIQDILNNLRSTAPTLAHASFVADGEYELYILAVPYTQTNYCDTHLVFDLRHRQWSVWTPANGSLSLGFNINVSGTPQWLFIDGTGTHINIYNSSAITDNGTAIPITASSTWMHLGEPTRRKVLNDIQVYGNTNMTISIDGANNQADFSSPESIVYNRALRVSPFNVWTLYLTGQKSRHRYYRFTFQANNGVVPFLGSYVVSLAALDDI